MKVKEENFIRLKSLAQKLELPSFLGKSLLYSIAIRMKMAGTHGNHYLLKSLQALLMILPQNQAYFALYNRLKCLNLPSMFSDEIPESDQVEDEKEDMGEYLKIFDKTADILNKNP